MTPPSSIGSIFAFFERIITDFTWRQIGGTITLFLALVALVFIVLELYTQSFMLTRLDREVSLLERMLEVQDQIAKTNDEALKKTFESLSLDLSHLVQGSSYANTIQLSPRVIKALSFLLPWVVLTLLIVFVGQSRGTETRSAVIGIFVVAIPVMFVGGYIPDSGRNWIDYLLIPWILAVIVIAAIMLIQRLKDRVAPPGGS